MGDEPGRNRGPPIGVDLDDPDLAARLGETGRGHQAHVAGTDDADHTVIGLLCHELTE